MANNTARIKGDDYQVLYFWKEAIKLFQDKHIEKVYYEEGEKAFDDVLVCYNEPIFWHNNGEKKLLSDYYQIKFKKREYQTFDFDELLDPGFTGGTAISILERLKDIVTDKGFISYTKRFTLVLRVKATGKLAELIEESSINVKKLDNNGYKRVKNKLLKALNVDIDTLRQILGHLRIIEGISRDELIDQLNLNFNNEGIKAIDNSTKVTVPHVDLIRTLYSEKNVKEYTKEILTSFLINEDLMTNIGLKGTSEVPDVSLHFQIANILDLGDKLKLTIKSGILNGSLKKVDYYKVRFFIQTSLNINQQLNAIPMDKTVKLNDWEFKMYHCEHKPPMGSVLMGANKTISEFEITLPKQNNIYMIAWLLNTDNQNPCMGNITLYYDGTSPKLGIPSFIMISDEQVRSAVKKAQGLN